MAPIIYMKYVSPPCRAVLLTARAIGIELDIKEFNIADKSHLEPWFLTMNPQHTIPTLSDDGFILTDSHAICTYLISKYVNNDSLYPTHNERRAQIDQRLFFNNGTLQPILKELMEGETTVPENITSLIQEVYGFCEIYLTDHDWFVGDELTVADLCLFPTLSSLNVVVPVDGDSPKLTGWLTRLDELPYADANNDGLAAFRGFIESILA